MEQEEINRLRELAADADRKDDDIRYYSGGSKHNASAEKLTEYIRNALPTLLAQAERVKVLEAALESALNVLENSGAESGYCMCGDPVASHTIGSGHSPVDSHGYMAEQVIVECRTALEQTGATRD